MDNYFLQQNHELTSEINRQVSKLYPDLSVIYPETSMLYPENVQDLPVAIDHVVPMWCSSLMLVAEGGSQATVGKAGTMVLE